jgi:DNA-binding transcriptional LysR family regulator
MGRVAVREIEAEPVVDDEIVVVGPPSLAGITFQPRDLQEYTWISREEGSATRAAVEAAWHDLSIAPHARLELPSWEAVKLAVVHGIGIAACSRLAIQVELKAGTLAVLDVPRWKLWRTISVIYMADTPLTSPAEQFLCLLREHAQLRGTDQS